MRPPLLRAPQPGLSVVRLPSQQRAVLLKPPLFRAPSLAVKGDTLWGDSLTASDVECSQAKASTLKSSPTRIECARLPLVQRVILLKPPLSRAPLRPYYVHALSWASLAVVALSVEVSSHSGESPLRPPLREPFSSLWRRVLSCVKS